MTLNNDTNIFFLSWWNCYGKRIFWNSLLRYLYKIPKQLLVKFSDSGVEPPKKNCWNNSNGNIGDIFEKFWPIYWNFITDVIFLGVWLDIFQWGIQMSFVMVYFWIMNRISMLSDLERIQLMLNEDSHYEWIDADKIQKKLLILPLKKLWMVRSLPTVPDCQMKITSYLSDIIDFNIEHQALEIKKMSDSIFLSFWRLSSFFFY